MPFIRNSIILLVSLIMGSPAMAADLTDLSWLAGTWVEKPSEHKTIEIHWSQPDGNSMVGTYRVTIDDKLLMYEILTIIADKDRITYRFDLFGKSSDFQNPATSNFRLTANSGTTAHFEGKFGGEGPLMLLTIERSSEDILTGWMVEASNPEGKRFVGYRAKLQK